MVASHGYELSPPQIADAEALAERRADQGVYTQGDAMEFAIGQQEYLQETADGRNEHIDLSAGAILQATGRRGPDYHGDPIGGYDEHNQPVWHPNTDSRSTHPDWLSPSQAADIIAEGMSLPDPLETVVEPQPEPEPIEDIRARESGIIGAVLASAEIRPMIRTKRPDNSYKNRRRIR